jgi:putative aminopeptidase FrvX
MALNEALLKRLIETPGVSGREERQREIAREELGSLTDEVRIDALGSVIGTKQGSGDARVMVAAHTDEIGYLVKHIDDKGFVRLQTLGGHDPANMVSQRVLVTTADGETLRGALQPSRKPPHLARGEDQKPPKADEFYVDLGMDAETVKEKVRVGDYVVMDRTLEKVGENYVGKAMDDRIGVFVMYEALRAMGDHQATIFAAATSQEEVGVRGAEASGSALEPTVVVALDVGCARWREREHHNRAGQRCCHQDHGQLFHLPSEAGGASAHHRRARGYPLPDGDTPRGRHGRGRRTAPARWDPRRHALHPLPLRPHPERDGERHGRRGRHNAPGPLPRRGLGRRLRALGRSAEGWTFRTSRLQVASFRIAMERVVGYVYYLDGSTDPEDSVGRG